MCSVQYFMVNIIDTFAFPTFAVFYVPTSQTLNFKSFPAPQSVLSCLFNFPTFCRTLLTLLSCGKNKNTKNNNLNSPKNLSIYQYILKLQY